MTTRALLASLVPALVLASCNTGPVECGLSIPDAVSVIVRDSVTGILVADGASGVVILDAHTDSLLPGRLYGLGDSVLIGGTRVGGVTVRVERPGYQIWSQSGVQTHLSTTVCPAFVTVALTARLQR